MARMNSGTIIGSVFGSTPDEIVPYLANGLARTAAWDLTHLHGLGHDQLRQVQPAGQCAPPGRSGCAAHAGQPANRGAPASVATEGCRGPVL